MVFNGSLNRKVGPHFATLTLLETVLGIDNIIFISILAGKLPADRQGRARRLGLLLAMGTRILLYVPRLILKLTQPLFAVFGQAIGRDLLILVLGYRSSLLASTFEIHDNLEGRPRELAARRGLFAGVLVQIALLDIVFSPDSVITARWRASLR